MPTMENAVPDRVFIERANPFRLVPVLPVMTILVPVSTILTKPVHVLHAQTQSVVRSQVNTRNGLIAPSAIAQNAITDFIPTANSRPIASNTKIRQSRFV